MTVPELTLLALAWLVAFAGRTASPAVQEMPSVGSGKAKVHRRQAEGKRSPQHIEGAQALSTIQKGLQISCSTDCWFDPKSLEDVLLSVEKERHEPVTRRFIIELKHKYKYRLILDRLILDESISFGTATDDNHNDNIASPSRTIYQLPAPYQRNGGGTPTTNLRQERWRGGAATQAATPRLDNDNGGNNGNNNGSDDGNDSSNDGNTSNDNGDDGSDGNDDVTDDATDGGGDAATAGGDDDVAGFVVVFLRNHIELADPRCQPANPSDPSVPIPVPIPVSTGTGFTRVQEAKEVSEEVAEGKAKEVVEDGVLGAKAIGIAGEPLLYALEAGTVVSEGNRLGPGALGSGPGDMQGEDGWDVTRDTRPCCCNLTLSQLQSQSQSQLKPGQAESW
ncbi:hypothetical protein EDB85DRAFT_1901071 [Lactarius pseudohatsudake]|nr:hypothetical protein EDB85DRAFT_1901071 [Lactarius pseudohatsudake]